MEASVVPVLLASPVSTRDSLRVPPGYEVLDGHEAYSPSPCTEFSPAPSTMADLTAPPGIGRFDWGLSRSTPDVLTILEGLSRVQRNGLKRDDVGGGFLATSYAPALGVPDRKGGTSRFIPFSLPGVRTPNTSRVPHRCLLGVDAVGCPLK
jgi:hypothetical protein